MATYTVCANIYPTKIGTMYGRIAHTTVEASNEEDAIEKGKQSFRRLCNRLRYKNSTFNFDNLQIE